VTISPKKKKITERKKALRSINQHTLYMGFTFRVAAKLRY